MKKILLVFLIAGCASFLSAQSPIQTESSEFQTELRKIHSTLKALERSQASQKKTFNILASRMENRVDSLQAVLHATQLQAQQATDSLAGISKVQMEHAARMGSIESSLDTRTALLILAIVALAGLSLVIFFTLKKAIGEASELILKQVLKPVQASESKRQGTQASALVVDSPQKKSAITLPIEPELFTPAEEPTREADVRPVRTPQPELHVAIAEMIAAPERNPEDSGQTKSTAAHAPHKKATGQCQGVTKSGARCKRKALAGTHFCSQHTK
jgi:hypothetical protein